MARRPTKLEFHEHYVTCPYCRTEITVYSLMEAIIAAGSARTVSVAMLIDHGKAVRLLVEGTKKPPKQVRSPITKAQNG